MVQWPNHRDLNSPLHLTVILNQQMEEIPQTKSHSIDDCISLVKSQTQTEPVSKVLKFLQTFEETGFDALLGTFTNLLRRDTIPHVLSFLRVFRVLDVSDCERITNKSVNQTTDEEIMALVNILNTKGPHAYWYVVHSMKEHTEFFSQMHGKLVCCVCEEVAENYDILMQKEIEKEFASAEPPSLQFSKQGEMLNDLLRRVEQLRENFSCLENSFTEIMERIKPFPDMMGTLSQRVRDEIKDVVTQTEPDGEVGGHTNVKVINRLKQKYAKLKRQIENRLHFRSRDGQVNTDNNNKDVLKEVVCKEPNPREHITENKEGDLPCRTYEDLWIQFEDQCFEKVSQYNPFTAIQRSIGKVLVFGQQHKGKIYCVIGITICVKIIGSYLMEYAEWTEEPSPVFK